MSVDSDDPPQQQPAAVAGAPPGPLPKGMVLGPDGKPCRTCSSKSAFSAFAAQATASRSKPATAPTAAPSHFPAAPADDDCPADVDTLGRGTWTLLHSIAATYPAAPSPAHQHTTRGFFAAFAQLYPCWHCAGDFRAWMARAGNEPRVSSRAELGQWLCEAHNAVNVKLGKPVFDCARWEERWRTGWRDGRCD